MYVYVGVYTHLEYQRIFLSADSTSWRQSVREYKASTVLMALPSRKEKKVNLTNVAENFDDNYREVFFSLNLMFLFNLTNINLTFG